MEKFTVIYCEPPSMTWQYFVCHADDVEHAEEQCFNAYPKCEILWVNEGEQFEML